MKSVLIFGVLMLTASAVVLAPTAKPTMRPTVAPGAGPVVMMRSVVNMNMTVLPYSSVKSADVTVTVYQAAQGRLAIISVPGLSASAAVNTYMKYVGVPSLPAPATTQSCMTVGVDIATYYSLLVQVNTDGSLSIGKMGATPQAFAGSGSAGYQSFSCTYLIPN